MDLYQGMTRHSARKVLLTIIRKWYWLFVFAVLFAFLVSTFYWYKAYSEYRVSATFIPVVQNEADGAQTDLGRFSALAAAPLLKNDEILQAVSKSLDFEVSIDALSEAITLNMEETAAAVSVIVAWHDKAQANMILDAYKANLDFAITHTANAGAIKWMNAVESGSTPVTQNKTLAYIIFIAGALFGILIGACFAYFTGSLDKRVFDLDKVCIHNNRMLIIGTAGKENRIKNKCAHAHARLTGRHGRQVMASALYLNKLLEEQNKRLVMCVSPSHKCGTSTVTRKISQILSHMKMKILIVTLKNKPSKDVLPEKTEIMQISDGIDGCTCIWDASESNRSFVGAISTLLSGAMQQYTLIMVDCPPILENIEISAFAEGMDAALLVCRYGRTKYEEVPSATSLLLRTQAIPVYCIWNFAPHQYDKKIFLMETAVQRRAQNE